MLISHAVLFVHVDLGRPIAKEISGHILPWWDYFYMHASHYRGLGKQSSRLTSKGKPAQEKGDCLLHLFHVLSIMYQTLQLEDKLKPVEIN